MNPPPITLETNEQTRIVESMKKTEEKQHRRLRSSLDLKYSNRERNRHKEYGLKMETKNM